MNSRFFLCKILVYIGWRHVWGSEKNHQHQNYRGEKKTSVWASMAWKFNFGLTNWVPAEKGDQDPKVTFRTFSAERA
jgi:hypothetical protein